MDTIAKIVDEMRERAREQSGMRFIGGFVFFAHRLEDVGRRLEAERAQLVETIHALRRLLEEAKEGK